MAGFGDQQLATDAQSSAIKTWRYLRLAMIVLVVGLGISILYEHSQTSPSCFQDSISAYYYTPVQGFFVGALVAVGTCLICLKGNTEWEDTLLNLAGMFAPVVALVPTPNPGSCASRLGTTLSRNANIENNMVTLLAVGALGLVVVLVNGLHTRRTTGALPGTAVIAGWCASVLAWITAAVVFFGFRDLFTTAAHYTAAILMFVCILAIVVINAFSYRVSIQAERPANRYSAIAVAMVVSVAVTVVLWRVGWDYWVLGIEVALITLFALFWAIQTAELWEQGLRDSSTG